MKKLMTGLAGAVLALATNVSAEAANTTTQDTTMKQDTAMQGDTQMLPVAGVVTKIDKKANTLTIVSPGSTTVDMTKYGKALVTERETNLFTLQAPIGQGAPLIRDGKSAKIGDIKEGDVVRTNFDPNAMTFNGVTAVSQKHIEKDIKEAQKELKREIKTMEKEGKKMNQ